MTHIITAFTQSIIWMAAIISVFLSTVTMAHAAGGSLESPLNPSISSIPAFIAQVLKAIVIMALPIATLFIVISGFMFLVAQGKPDKLANAKKNFMYVIIGTLLILGATVLVTIIVGTVTQLFGRNS